MLQKVISIPSHVEFIGIFCTIPERQREALNISVNSTSKQLIDALAFVPEKNDRDRSHLVPAGSNDDRLNIVILGLDSVSRMNLLRVMPDVHNFLTQDLGAISMDGYVKVGGKYPRSFRWTFFQNSLVRNL